MPAGQGAEAPLASVGRNRAERFGHIVTVDHVRTLNAEAASVEGASALTFEDLATGWIACESVVHKSEEDTTAALQHVIGPKGSVDLAHSGGPGEIRLACKTLGLTQQVAHCSAMVV